MASSNQGERFTGICPICYCSWSQLYQRGETAVRNNVESCKTHYLCSRCYAEIAGGTNKCPHCRAALLDWKDATSVAKEEAPPTSRGKGRTRRATIQPAVSSQHIDAYTCDICKKRFKNTGTLSHHRKRHFPEQYQNHHCEICLKKYYTKSDLTRHQTKAHQL